MNNIEAEKTAPPSQAVPRVILYFRYGFGVGSAIQQVEYDLLQTNLSQHRGYNDNAADLCQDGYWAVVATSETGMGADAVTYTTKYLRSISVVDPLSITTTPPSPNPS